MDPVLVSYSIISSEFMQTNDLITILFLFFLFLMSCFQHHTRPKKKMTKRKKKRSKISFTVSINFYCRNYTIRTMGKSSKTWFKSPWWSQGHSSKTQRWRIPDVVRFVETQSYLSKNESYNHFKKLC